MCRGSTIPGTGSEGSGILSGQIDIGTGADHVANTMISQRPPWRQTLAEAGALVRRVTKPSLDALEHEASAGDGHAVLVLPALLRGDGYTISVRRFLTAIG